MTEVLRAGGVRVAQAVLTLLVASTITFLLQPLAPGDAALTLLAKQGRQPTPDAVAAERHRLGLDRPLPVQYATWLDDVVHGDLGRSWVTQAQVSELVGRRVGPTALLGGIALGLGLLVALAWAAASVLQLGRWPDHLVRAVVLLTASVPAFVLGLLTLQYVVVQWGVGSVLSDGSLRTVTLPALVLALGVAAGWARPLRALVSEQMRSSYVETTMSRGSGRHRALLVHALPNAMVPFLGLVSLGLGAVLGGATVVETVFAWPGLGNLAVTAVKAQDVPVIQAVVLVSTAGYVGGSLVADLAALLLDPRQRVAAGGGRRPS